MEAVDNAARELYDTIAARYGVGALTAYMALAAMEAIFPLAAAETKLETMRSLKSAGDTINAAAFSHAVLVAIKCEGGYMHEEVLRRIKDERLRQMASSQAVAPAIEVPRTTNEALEDELQARAARIAQLEAESAKLMHRLRDEDRSSSFNKTSESAAVAAKAAMLRYQAQSASAMKFNPFSPQREAPNAAGGYATPTRVSPAAAQSALMQYATSPIYAGAPLLADHALYTGRGHPQASAVTNVAASPGGATRFSALSHILQLERGATIRTFVHD